MNTKINVNVELLNTINQHELLIVTQNKVIAKLVADNMEKENMIHALLEEEEGFY